MFEVKVEKSADLLKIKFSAKVHPKEALECAEQIELLLGELQRGFRMLTDLSELEEMDLGCAPYIERVMDACNRTGIKMVVRIIPYAHKDIGLNIMSLFHYDRGVKIVTCRTLEEAHRALTR
jgi:hypothetical protein